MIERIVGKGLSTYWLRHSRHTEGMGGNLETSLLGPFSARREIPDKRLAAPSGLTELQAKENRAKAQRCQERKDLLPHALYRKLGGSGFPAANPEL